MDHKERVRLARDLCDRFVGKYTGSVVVGGVYGSTARGTDTQWSDLEVLFIVADGCGAQGQSILYLGTAVNYLVMRQKELESTLTNPRLGGDMGWPFWMGVLSVLKVLYGDPSRVEGWLCLGKTVPGVAFKEALEMELPGLIVESYGRLNSCRERRNQDDWYCAVLEVLFEMRDALCLLNQSWVTHDYYQGLVDTFEFPLLPNHYTEIVPALWRVTDIDTALRLAGDLVRDFYTLLVDEGIDMKNYDTVTKIPV